MLYIVTSSNADTLTKVVKPHLSGLGDLKVKFVYFEGDLPPTTKGDVVLTMGSKILTLLQSTYGVHKGKKVSALRESPISIRGAEYLVTYDPFIAVTNPALEVNFVWDIKLAIRLAKTGTVDPVLGEFKYLEDLQELRSSVEALADKTGKSVSVCCDTETIGLNCYDQDAWIESIQLAFRNGGAKGIEGYCIRFRSIENQPTGQLFKDIEWFLSSPKVKIVGANFKYDMRWFLEKWDMECTNFSFDTTIVGSLLNENRSNSLETHAKIYTSIGGYDSKMNKTYDKSRMDLIPDEDFLIYSVGDVVACLEVYEKMKEELLADPFLTRFYVELLHKSNNTFLELEHVGTTIDVECQEALEFEVSTSIKDLKEQMFEKMPMKFKLKHGDNLDLRPAVLQDYFFGLRGLGLKPLKFTAKTGKPSTAMEHFLMFDDVPEASEFVQLLKQHGSASKTLSTYITGFNKHRQYDNKYHATYMLHKGDFNGSSDSGTDTGRCVTAGTMILTDKGEVEITTLIDRYSQGESFKIWTHKSRWKSMIGAYNNGMKPVLELQVGDHTLVSTYNHPIMSFPTWKLSGDLTVGDYAYIKVAKPTEAGAKVKGIPFEVSLEVSRELIRYVRLFKKWIGRKDSMAGFCPVQVNSLKDKGTAQTYDITVEDDHSYIANGIVVHNSSAKCPAIQCQVGSSLIHCKGGNNTLQSIVEGFEGGRPYEVLSHTGEWRKVIAVYRNGVQPVFTVTTSSGKMIECTANHPLLLSEGFVRTDHTLVGDSVYTLGGLSSAADKVRLNRGGVSLPDRLTLYTRPKTKGGLLKRSTTERVDRGVGYYDSYRAAQAGFILDRVVSIVSTGSKETYDLTVEEDHSFVANDIVVHNTVPKHTLWAKKLRKAYTAPKGMMILSCDYSAGEMRVAAEIAHETNMIKAFNEGVDIHCVTAAFLMEMDYDVFMGKKESDPKFFKESRQGAKAANFGLLYGMSADGYQAYAETAYGNVMTVPEATEQRRLFLEVAYPKLTEWHTNTKAFAHRHGYVRSPLGRLRHLPLINDREGSVRSKAERNAINSSVQGTLSDLTQYSLYQVKKEYGFGEVKPFMMVHDDLKWYVPEKDAELWAERICYTMSHLPLEEVFGWKPKLRFDADAEIGYNLADMEEL